MMSNDQLDLKILDQLSPEERAAALEILQQYATSGKSDLLDNWQHADWDEIPVDIDTFLDDDKYLGRGIWSTDQDTGEKRCTLFPYWRNMLHKLFPDNQTTAYNTLILTGCLAYDTEIPLLDGKIEKIGDLAKKENLDEYVYSYDTDTNQYVPGHLIKAFSTGTKPVYEIELDNGTKIKATSNHKFMTRDKHWKSIDSGLAVGDSMMPAANKNLIKIKSVKFIGNEEVFDLTVEKYHNFAINKGIIAHNSIGLGKTLVAVLAQLYLLYRMLCLKDPYEYFGLMPSDKITFSMLNITLETAKGVGWDKLQQLVQGSEWFMNHGSVNASRTAPTWQPDKHIELIFGSNNNHVIGRALFCLDGDTKIMTATGEQELKSLVNKQVQVISVDDNGKEKLSEPCEVKPTVKTNLEYKITLADDSIIECTENHLFKLTSGEYKMAKDLKETDELAEPELTYKQFIGRIIASRGQWNEKIKADYCERHHILPKCLGGKPNQLNWSKHPNIIWLTAQEHFIAHKLLAKENPDNDKLVSAFKRMCYSIHCKYKLTKEDYDLVKRQWAKAHSKALKGTKHDHHIIKNLDQYKKMKSDQMTGKNNNMYGKGYKIAGNKNGCFGHPVEPERLNKIRQSNAKYIYTFNQLDFYGWHELQKYLHKLGYPISQKGIESCVTGKITIKSKYPELYLKITKRLKEKK